jgi:Zn-dependent protease
MINVVLLREKNNAGNNPYLGRTNFSMLERISRKERFDLIVAWLAISIAFSLIFPRPDLLSYVMNLVLSMITVGVGFVLHEMAHKFTAMKFGYWAEFRKDNVMLLVAIVLAALVGVVFAAPGATVIYGTGITREQNGRISVAGPLTNLLLCIPFAVFIAISGGLGPEFAFSSLLSAIGIIGLQVNAMIAAFNLLPVSVLDGRKILAWNPAIFAVMIVTAFGILIATFYPLIF